MRVEIGLSAQRTETLLARGMLINTLLNLRLPDLVEADQDADTLLRGIFRETFDDVVATAAQHAPLPEAHRSAEPAG
ncbi:hypothetical protein M3E18_07260 [Kocuria sp. p3-SID1433]|uniref:hypothetical protein n=1 Tax=unclassified Kocuria TaxID=2649579 RepID=UPI0021A9710E|nr:MULTISPECIES: hypothetical protein [unclassified Kocuria]MCT1602153.1 hypothetical protein [Kocuria sp. p3-SID1428]MCT2180329.1 hypothetical protein [Kocuria sp. p3-SID1433]